MNYTILSCSLDPQSRSRDLAKKTQVLVEQAEADVQFIDMRESPLPPFDNDAIYETAAFLHIHAAIAEADGIFMATPIYNWSVGSVAKKLIEATGSTGQNGRKAAWFDKVVTFLCAGGLPHSYMAHGSLAMSLMFDFKCVINPYSVYTTDRDWSEHGELSERLSARLRKTVAVQLELTAALSTRRYSSDWEV